MVVVCGNGGRESFAKGDGFLGSLDLHLEFRLLVFLDAEGEMRIRNLSVDPDVVVSQSGFLLQVEIESRSAEFIRDEIVFLEDNLISPIADFDGGGFPGVCGNVAEIVTRLARPNLQVHRLAGAIDGAIGDADGFLRDVIGAAAGIIPVEMAIREIGAAIPGAGDDVPLEVVVDAIAGEHQLSALICFLPEMFRDGIEPALADRLPKVIRPVAEELQLPLHRRSGLGIGKVENLFAALGAFQEDEVANPYDNPGFVAILKVGFQHVATRRELSEIQVRCGVAMRFGRFQILLP